MPSHLSIMQSRQSCAVRLPRVVTLELSIFRESGTIGRQSVSALRASISQRAVPPAASAAARAWREGWKRGNSAVTNSGDRSHSRSSDGHNHKSCSRRRNSCCSRTRVSCCSHTRRHTPVTIVAVVIGGGLGGGETGCAERGGGGDRDEGVLEGVHVHLLQKRCRTGWRDQRGQHGTGANA